MDGADLRVEPLAPVHGGDFLRFFDPVRVSPVDAMRARCHCHFHHVAPVVDWNTLDARANSLAMEARIACGEMEGYFAWRGSVVVGWLNAQARHRLLHCDARIGVPAPPLDVPAHDAAAIVCFVVAPGEPDDEVERVLLDGALANLWQRGIRVVDAYPATGPANEPASGSGCAKPGSGPCRGRRALFEAAGFTLLARHPALDVMRKRLDSPDP